MSEGNMTAIKIFGMPFITESLLILYLTIQKVVVPKIENRQSEMVRVDKENDLGESLLGRSEKKAIKIHSSFLGRAEQWFYELFDINFMPQFCNLSFKQDLLNKCSEKYGSQQTIVLGLIFLEIYFSLMSVVTTQLAPLMSAFTLYYSLTSLYSYLGLKTTKFLDFSQSYFVAFKLSAFLIGYLFDESVPISYRFEFNYFMMTLLLTVDAFYGFYQLITETRLRNESILEEEDSFIVANWKKNLFYKEREESEMFRTFGAFIITMEGIFSFSALFIRNNPAMVSLIHQVSTSFFI
jgi:hypothetical protein